MFCDGQCTKKNKKCGLLLTVTMSNSLTGQHKTEDKCAFLCMAESLWNQEHGQVRIQAAVESDRNEQAKWGREQNHTLAQGFLGLIHTVNANAEAERKVKFLRNVKVEDVEDIEQIEYIEGEVEE